MNYFSIFESYKSLDQVGNDINKLIPSEASKIVPFRSRPKQR
jgi:hypothetical protein